MTTLKIILKGDVNRYKLAIEAVTNYIDYDFYNDELIILWESKEGFNEAVNDFYDNVDAFLLEDIGFDIVSIDEQLNLKEIKATINKELKFEYSDIQISEVLKALQKEWTTKQFINKQQDIWQKVGLLELPIGAEDFPKCANGQIFSNITYGIVSYQTKRASK